MVPVVDVAGYILRSIGPTPAMKLQKLVYYSQAWSLVWDDALLFEETIEAWANGPVARELYTMHRLQYILDTDTFNGANPDNLSAAQRETVDAVLDFYGDKSSQWLSDLTHQEEPWQRARKGISDGEHSRNTIYPAWMAEYYGGL